LNELRAAKWRVLHPLFMLFKYSISAKLLQKVVSINEESKQHIKRNRGIGQTHRSNFKRDGGVVEASVFDSFTRGEVHPNSDLDLLVRYKETVSLFDVGGLKYDLEKLLGIKVDLISREYLKPRIKKRVLQESVRIL